MKTLLLIFGVLALISVRAGEDTSRIYVHLFRGSGEYLAGFGQRDGEESATTVCPPRGDSFVVVLKPMRRGEEALVGIRFYRDASEVRLPAEGLTYIWARWDILTRIFYGGTDYSLIATLSEKPPRSFKRPNKAPEPTPTAVTPPAAQEPRQP